jgi:hypothetical protein
LSTKALSFKSVDPIEKLIISMPSFIQSLKAAKNQDILVSNLIMTLKKFCTKIFCKKLKNIELRFRSYPRTFWITIRNDLFL